MSGVAGRAETQVVCPLCVQWRCAVCKSDDWPECHGYDTESEAYWPDGSVATITQQGYCERCAQSVADYEAEHKDEVPF